MALNVRMTSPFTMHECLLWKDINDLLLAPTREIVEQLYVQHVISLLLGSEHVDAGIRILVAKEFLESIEKNVRCQRPACRVNDAKADTQCVSALILSDLSLFPHSVLKDEFCISVEIKISEISEYDPLDLFSGSIDRVNKAMNDLFLMPQNNFRVFLNGSLIFGGLGGGTDMTGCLTGEAFEDVLKCVILANNGMRTTIFLQLVAEAVFSSGLLKRLLEVQKLDKLDIEGAIHAYYNVVSQPCMLCRKLGEDKEKLSEKYTSLHSDPLSKSLKIVKDYLVAATAKDLSMMISFRPTENRDLGSSHDVILLKSTNQSFEYKKTVVSVDLLCSKCRKKVMKLISTIEGINSIVLDPSKNTATVIGEADPVCIIKKARKFRRSVLVLPRKRKG